MHEAEKQYETARADLSPLLNQARTQLDHLSEQTRAEIQRLSEAPAPTTGSDVIIGPDGIPIVLDEVPATPAAPTNEKGKGVERGEDGGGEGAQDAEAAGLSDDTPESHQATQQTPAAAASAFFSKWQSQLASNPNVKDLSRNISSLQSNLSTNLHQIQNQLTHLDLTEGQKVADRYLHKGEAWFQEFSAEVAHLAKEAVKVVPPTGGGVAGSTTTTGRSGFERAGTPVMTRRDMVMHKLRTDTSLLLIDPAQPPAASSPQTTTDLSASTSAALMMSPDTREAYAAFLSSVQARGGLDGDAFRADVERELLDGGEVLAQTRDQLVPAQIPEEVFWARYFFRKQCVEEEEERRKKVLQGKVSGASPPPRYQIPSTLLIPNRPQSPSKTTTISAGTWTTRNRSRRPGSRKSPPCLLSPSRLPRRPRPPPRLPQKRLRPLPPPPLPLPFLPRRRRNNRSPPRSRLRKSAPSRPMPRPRLLPRGVRAPAATARARSTLSAR